jgi:hypothetical protein
MDELILFAPSCVAYPIAGHLSHGDELRTPD